MKSELMYLVWVTILTALLWIPYVLDRIAVWGLADTVGYPENPKLQSPWARRLKAAHANASKILSYSLFWFLQQVRSELATARRYLQHRYIFGPVWCMCLLTRSPCHGFARSRLRVVSSPRQYLHGSWLYADAFAA